jgi:hypothetical protein
MGLRFSLNLVKFKENWHKIRLIRCKSVARLRIIRRFVFPLYAMGTQPVITGIFVCEIEELELKDRGTQR